MKLKHWLPLAALALVALVAPAALAAENNSFDRIVDLYRNGAENWEGPLLTIARRLFGLLVLCEFAWAMIRQVLKGSDLAEFAGEIVNQIMYIGFFLFLMTNSTELAHAIIDSFRKAGDIASSASGGSAGVRPSDIFEAGLKVSTATLKAALAAGATAIPEAIGMIIAAVFTLCAFALIGAYMIIALVESYIISSAGVLMMGFGGSRMTKDYAVKALTFAVSVGAKLFVMQLIVGLGEGLMKTMSAGVTPGTMMKPEDIFTMLGFAIVLVVLTKTIPDQVQGLINGVSANSSGNMMASAVSGAVGGAIGGALGAGNAVAQSFRLASQQLAGEGGGEKGAGGGGEGGGEKKGGALAAMGRVAGQAGKLSAMAGKNLAGAAASDFGARLAGHGRHGSAGGRMAHDMSKARRELAREQKLEAGGAEGGDKKDAKADAAAGAGAASAAGAAGAAATEAAGTIRGADEASTAADGAEGGGAAAETEGGEAAQSAGDDVNGAQSSASAAGAAETAGAGGDSGQSDTVAGASGSAQPAPEDDASDHPNAPGKE